MATSYVTAIQGVSADNLTANLVNLSTYTTPAREDVALYLYFYKRNAQQEDTAVVVSNTAPTTVTQWNFTLAGDGWYRAIIFEFPIWTAGAYAADKCVYHSGSYYKANTSTTETPGAGSEWDLITDILDEVLELAGSGVTIGTTNNFITPNIESGSLANKLQDLGPNIKAGKCKDISSTVDALYGKGLLESAWQNFARGDYVEAQEIVDYLNNQYS